MKLFFLLLLVCSSGCGIRSVNDKFILCVMHVINHPDIVRCRNI